MLRLIRLWYERNFSDPQAVILLILITGGFLVVIYFGTMLAPLLTSIVLAYMMEPVVELLQRHRVPRLISVIFVSLLFILLAMLILLWLIPVLSNQVTQLITDLPLHIDQGRQALLELPQMYPKIFNEGQVNDILSAISGQVRTLGQKFLSFSLASIPVLFTLVIYLFLVPLLIFFFLKDKTIILEWLKRYLPKERGLAAKVWEEMDHQIGNYVRGKIAEIVIAGGATYIVFLVMGLNYSMLLAVLVGLSVIIPFIGAAAVTVPVVMIAYFQWGWSSEFAYLLLAYGIIQALDGNVLVPLLFSEAVNLHPIAIILSVLVFGGIWGLWGVFFAIPLATLVKAVLDAWPTSQTANRETGSENERETLA
jgi:putative permease